MAIAPVGGRSVQGKGLTQRTLISQRPFQGSISFIPESTDLGTPVGFWIYGHGRKALNKRRITFEFKDGLGKAVTSYSVLTPRRWKGQIFVPILREHAENPVVAALWTMTGRWEALRRPFRCGMAGDKGELYGCELVIRCDE